MIIDLQRRLAEIGRIRIGQQLTSPNGKARPAKLDTFRLTSPDKTRIEHAARLWGGRPKQWEAPAGKQWEVITSTAVIDVIVPPSDMAFSQWYELWSAGGCQRRCDGRFESISDGPCLCDPDNRACDIHSRLSVLLADLPGLGVWRIDTSGYYAAVELQGAVEVIQLAAGRGQMLPARLRLEQRAVKRPDPETGKPVTRRFAVPMLDIEVSPGQLMSGAAGQLAIADNVDAATGEVVDASVPLTPVPASVPHHRVGTVAEQARAVEQPAERTPRKNAAAPVAATGLAPRTAAQAAADADQSGDQDRAGPATAPPYGPDRPAERTARRRTPPDASPAGGAPDQVEQPEAHPVTPLDELAQPEQVTADQLRAIHTIFTRMDISDRNLRMAYARNVLDIDDLPSSKDLTKDQASRLLDVMHEELHAMHSDEESPTDQPPY